MYLYMKEKKTEGDKQCMNLNATPLHVFSFPHIVHSYVYLRVAQFQTEEKKIK